MWQRKHTDGNVSSRIFGVIPDTSLPTKLEHIDVHHHWLQQEVQEDRLRINWMSTTGMPADGLMKALPRQKHEAFVRQIGLIDISESEEQELPMPD